MSTVLADIRSTNWQISTAGFGVIAEGLEDVRQCLDLLLRTSKGSDPFRPEFGSNIFHWVDAPVTVAVPNVKRAIIEAVEIWEKRVVLQTINHYYEGATLKFDVTYKLANQDIIDSLVLSADGIPTGGVSQPGSLILQAFYPPNPNGRRYYLTLVFDEHQATPFPPAEGFATLNGLYAWAIDNLAYAGRWVQLIDRIVLYLNPGFATTASIAIELLTGLYTYHAALPFLMGDEKYQVSITTPDDNGFFTIEFEGQPTKDTLLTYLRAEYSEYGTWNIVAGSVDLMGDFNSVDFSSDFNIGSTGYYLELITSTLPSAELNVIAV